MGLYENVKTAAKEKGYSINRLEKEMGFPRSYIAKFKTIMPSADKIQRIADFLGVTSEYLMTGNEEKKDYYTNIDTLKAAQALFDDPNFRILFDAAQGASPEAMLTAADVLNSMKNREKGNDDSGC